MKKKNDTWINILLIIIFLTGLSLLLYPTVSDYWNSIHASRAISTYSNQVSQMGHEEYSALIKQAQKYNRGILKRKNVYAVSDDEKKEYESCLNVSGSGVMGYVEIPSIDVSLPIYHSTDESVLQVAVGHLEWTSLPVGGESTHTVLSGHRGLPSAKLFTNLDKVIEGDIFMLRILNETLTYQVDQILIVEPGDIEPLKITKGMDYCTLVTCTPYGVNTHRMLVRGHRVVNEKAASVARIKTEAIQIEELLVATVLAVPLLIVLLMAVFIYDGRKHKKSRRRK